MLAWLPLHELAPQYGIVSECSTEFKVGGKPPNEGVLPPTEGVAPPTEGVAPPTEGVAPPTREDAPVTL